MAGTFLKVLHTEGVDALHAYAEELHQGLILIMTALGANSIQSLTECPVVIVGETAEWCRTRGIDLTSYAGRTNPSK
ncbi:Isopentenyl-diphosphate delta-isomerase [compost metagenome]